MYTTHCTVHCILYSDIIQVYESISGLSSWFSCKFEISSDKFQGKRIRILGKAKKRFAIRMEVNLILCAVCTTVQLSLCPAKVDLEENCSNEGPGDEVAAEVEGPGDVGAADVLGPRNFNALEVRWRQKNNSKNLHSQVTIKEEKLGELGMWEFSDVIIGEVLNILQHWIQSECS